jgi:hypothetical protein
MVNHANLSSTKSRFILSCAFTPGIPCFTVGVVVIMRDIGVKAERRAVNLQDSKRRKQDQDQTAAILKVLNEDDIRLGEKDFRVFAQTAFDTEELYWKSIDHVLMFMRQTAGARAVISGKFLCELFAEAKPAITSISDFQNPEIPFETILGNHVRRQLETARDFAIADLAEVVEVVEHEMNNIPSAQLRQGYPDDLSIKQIRFRQERFKACADRLYSHVLQLFPDVSNKVGRDH